MATLATIVFVMIIVGFVIAVAGTAQHHTELVVRENLKSRYEAENYYEDEEYDEYLYDEESYEPTDPDNPVFYDEDGNFLEEKYETALEIFGDNKSCS